MSRSSPLTPAQEMRVLVAFVAQPLVAALVAFAAFPIIEWTLRRGSGGPLVNPLQAALAIAMTTGLLAVFVVPLTAFPAFAWQIRRGPLTRRRVLVSGAVLGNVPLAALVVLLAIQSQSASGGSEVSRLSHQLLGLIRGSALGSMVGLVSASVFWLMVRRHVSPAGEAPAL